MGISHKYDDSGGLQKAHPPQIQLTQLKFRETMTLVSIPSEKEKYSRKKIYCPTGKTKSRRLANATLSVPTEWVTEPSYQLR